MSPAVQVIKVRALLALPQGARHQATWGEILGWESPYYQLITLALGICLAQQLSGINTVIFYSSDVCLHNAPPPSPPTLHAPPHVCFRTLRYAKLKFEHSDQNSGVAASCHCTAHISIRWCTPATGRIESAGPRLTKCNLPSQVFKQAGLSSPIGGACLVGVVNIAGTILSTAVTDHYGRKPLMIISHAGVPADAQRSASSESCAHRVRDFAMAVPFRHTDQVAHT